MCTSCTAAQHVHRLRDMKRAVLIRGCSSLIHTYLSTVNCLRGPGTPLTISARFGHLQIVKYLVEHGADVTMTGCRHGYRGLFFSMSAMFFCFQDNFLFRPFGLSFLRDGVASTTVPRQLDVRLCLPRASLRCNCVHAPYLCARVYCLNR